MRLYLFLALLFAIVCVFPPAHAQSKPTTKCPDINVKAEVVNTIGGNQNGKVTLKFEDGSDASDYYVFLTCAGCEKSEKAEGSLFKDLKPGSYDIYVIDKKDNKGCLKQLNIQVK
jgi:hypothetical protein